MISSADMENLRHMLGICSHIKKRKWGYRNHFAPGGADIQSMERLAAGLKLHQVRRAMVP
ncbi:hypothetical protein GGI1_02220 [Acidithiobacillus sp. GGI-221]|nr:hypothetical protein GGI1_02220 [Acidithiobacillus sp. GGI-221]